MPEQIPHQSEPASLSPDSQQPFDAMGAGVAVLDRPDAERSFDISLHVAETANYHGSWMNLQQERMNHSDFRLKFKRFLGEHMASLLPDSASGMYNRPDNFQSHYREQLENFDTTLSFVYSAVRYGRHNEVGGKMPTHMGHGRIGKQATVYSDGVSLQGRPLTDRQKDITAAHEAYHGMVDAKGTARDEVKAAFDWVAYNALIDANKVARASDLRRADELMARMAQLKNYFGMKGEEEFTKQHLDYARDHYVEDTGLDNSMSVMMRMVSPRTEPDFLQLMNTLPV